MFVENRNDQNYLNSIVKKINIKPKTENTDSNIANCQRYQLQDQK